MLVATFAFPHDYWQDKPENRRYCALPHTKIGAVSKDSDDARGPCARPRCFGYRGDDSECAKTRFCPRFWIATLLHWERCADLRVVVFEGRFFLKNSAPHQAFVDEKKNRMSCHTIFRSYCGYYGRYYYRMTTVLTTIANRHGITTLLYHVG